MMGEAERSQLRHSLEFVGMRAQATAMGLVQLCIELRRAGVIDEAALDRVKEAIVEEIAQHAPRSMVRQIYQADIRGRLDRIFAGDEPIGQLPNNVGQALTDETSP